MAAPLFAHGCLACLEAVVAAQVGRHLDDIDEGESSNSGSEVCTSCSLPLDHVSFSFMLPCSSIICSFTVPADFGFFNFCDMPSSLFVFFLLPIVMGVG